MSWALTDASNNHVITQQSRTYKCDTSVGHSHTRLSLLAIHRGLSLLCHEKYCPSTEILIRHPSPQLYKLINNLREQPPHPLAINHDITSAIYHLLQKYKNASSITTPSKSETIQALRSKFNANHNPTAFPPALPDHHLLISTASTHLHPKDIFKQRNGYKALRQRLLDRLDITDDTFDKINWEAHKRALSLYDATDHLRLIKYIHGWLPTNEQKCKYGASTTDLCSSPSCHMVETQLHMFQCLCPRQRSNLNELLPNLEKYFSKTKTALSLRMAFKAGIRHWIHRHQNPRHQSTPFPTWTPNPYNTGASLPEHLTVITKAYSSQCSIGWDNLLRGRLSIHWAEAFLASKSIPSSSTAGQKWITGIIKTIWRIVLNLWAQRCTTMGETDLENEHRQAASHREQIEFRIQRLFIHGKYKTLPEDHHYLFTQHNLSTLLDQPFDTLLLWLNTYTSATNKWQQHMDGRLHNPIDRGPTQTTLHRFFQALPPSNPTSSITIHTNPLLPKHMHLPKLIYVQCHP